MKRMVCEICGSSSIKKENDVFVCQDCGTIYGLEEARKLLIDVDNDSNNETTHQTKPNGTSNNCADDKKALINALKSWAAYIVAFDGYYDWFVTDGYLDTAEFWRITPEEILDQPFSIKSSLDNSDFENKDTSILMSNKNLYFNKHVPSIEFSLLLLDDNTGEYKKLTQMFNDFDNSRRNYSPPYGSEIKFHYWLQTKDKKHKISFEDLFKTDDVAKDFIHKIPDDSKVEATYVKEEPVYRGLFSTRIEIVKTEGILPFSEKLSGIIESALYKRKLLKEIHNERYEYAVKHRPEMLKAYADLIGQKTIFEEMLNVPYKFRRVENLTALIDLLESGRADTWKEAMNLFEQKEHENRVIYRLDKIDNSLMEINNTLKIGFSYITSYLSNINSSVEKISSNVNDILKVTHENNYALKQIMFDTRYSLIASIIK